ncbi:MAG: FecR domain-containing protein [Verrucomicrobia bacterium]|jgi:hypothetical protein|nr:FecR domain-containing protein [Verrucomicrobiota bacterium]
MKQTQKLINWLVAGGVALAMVTSLTAQTAKERTGHVVRLKGAARYSTGNNIWQPVKTGTILKSGHIIQTAADSFVDVVLGETDAVPARVVVGDTITYQPKTEQDVIRVFEDSVLAFDKLTLMKTGADEVTETQLDLRAGKIFGWVKKMSTASRYEIKLPNGVAGVRGTTYSISAVGVVEVFTGSVVISWTGPDGNPMTQVISAGYWFDLRTLLLAPLPPERKPAVLISKPMASQGFAGDRTTYYVSPK